jgi:hypothetical protein
MAGMTALERMVKGERDKAVEEQAIMARAAEISAGAPLKFDEKQMGKALQAFVEFKKCARHYWGDVRDYLQVNGVSTVFGQPWCQSCDQRFSDGKAWARHMMSYRHFLDSNRATHEAVMELRAHLHAFPAPKEDFDRLDFYAIEKSYSFRNLPIEDDDEDEGGDQSDAPQGPWHAYLEDDEENNSCIYLQRDDDRAGRELFEMVEHDVRDNLPGQDTDYLRSAEEEAQTRNRAETSN